MSSYEVPEGAYAELPIAATALAWSPDGETLALASWDGVGLWTRAGELLAWFEGDRPGIGWWSDDTLAIHTDTSWARWHGQERLRFRTWGRPGERLVVGRRGFLFLDHTTHEAAITTRRGRPVTRLHRDEPVVAVDVVDGVAVALAGDALWSVESGEELVVGVAWIARDNRHFWLERGGPQSSRWPPVTGLDPDLAWPRWSVASGDVAAVRRDDRTWLLTRAAPAHRPPRDLVVIARAEDLPDPEALVLALRTAAADGDRLAWVVEGQSERSPWVEVDDPSAAASLRSWAREHPGGTAPDCVFPVEPADPVRDRVVVRHSEDPWSAPRCPGVRPLFLDDQLAWLSEVRAGW